MEICLWELRVKLVLLGVKNGESKTKRIDLRRMRHLRSPQCLTLNLKTCILPDIWILIQRTVQCAGRIIIRLVIRLRLFHGFILDCWHADFVAAFRNWLLLLFLAFVAVVSGAVFAHVGLRHISLSLLRWNYIRPPSSSSFAAVVVATTNSIVRRCRRH